MNKDVIETTSVIRHTLFVDRDFEELRAPFPTQRAGASSDKGGKEEEGEKANANINYYAWRRRLLTQASRRGALTVVRKKPGTAATTAGAAATSENPEKARADRRNMYLNFRIQQLEKKFSITMYDEGDEAAFQRDYGSSATAGGGVGSSSSSSSGAGMHSNASSRAASPRPSLSLLHTPTLSERFAFAGMHHIFGEQTEAVTVVKFANDTKDLLGFGMSDGTIKICTVVSVPQVVAVLKGHLGAITDLDWGITNEFILSSSADSTVRLWQARSGICTRIFNFEDVCSSCVFHPLNNNLFVTGTSSPKDSKGYVHVVNVSTGRSSSTFSTAKPITSICIDPTGSSLFVSDESGYITTLRLHSNGALGRSIRRNIKAAAWSLEHKVWYHQGRQDQLLLAACNDNTAKVFTITPVSGAAGDLAVMNTLPLSSRRDLVKAKFCPLLSTSVHPCVVTGGEDTNIYIYDVSRKDRKPINKLQAHSGVVHDVDWSYDEMLLATCDSLGMLYIWKRVLDVTI